MGTTRPTALHTRALFGAVRDLDGDSRHVERRRAPGPVADNSQRGFALTAACWAVGALVTAFVIGGDLGDAGLDNPSLHLILDSVNACVALLAAYLVHGRFLRQGRLQDLLLALGLALFAVAGLGVSVLSDVLNVISATTIVGWLPVAVLIPAATLVAVAGVTTGPTAKPADRIRWSLIAAVLTSVSLVVVVSIAHAMDSHFATFVLPAGGELAAANAGSSPLILAAQGWMAACMFIASIAFGYRSARLDDPLLAWFAPAFCLGAFARVNYMISPPNDPLWLHVGDGFRTACYLLLLIGAAREIRRYWTSRAGAAVVKDRRRLARELHDGVIQELAYIKAESLAVNDDSASALHIVAACDRALDEARAAVQALGYADDEALATVLHRAARELAERHDVVLDLDLHDAVDAEPDQRHALLRITREAVGNAVRHGSANRVQICLARVGSLRQLTITDDGKGFDVTAALALRSGYGLTSMSDRAEALPGVFTIDAEIDKGSVVRVTW